MDTKEPRVQNLLFLLSAAPLGMGCIIVSDDTDTDATPTTVTPTSTPGETDDPTTATTDAMTTSATGETTETPSDTTAADTTVGPSDTTSADTDEPPSAGCQAYADLVADCYMDQAAGDATLNYCNEQTTYYEMYGPECLSAFEDFIACLSALSCEMLMGAEPVCEAELEAVDTTCFPK